MAESFTFDDSVHPTDNRFCDKRHSPLSRPYLYCIVRDAYVPNRFRVVIYYIQFRVLRWYDCNRGNRVGGHFDLYECKWIVDWHYWKVRRFVFVCCLVENNFLLNLPPLSPSLEFLCVNTTTRSSFRISHLIAMGSSDLNTLVISL